MFKLKFKKTTSEEVMQEIVEKIQRNSMEIIDKVDCGDFVEVFVKECKKI